MTPALCQPWTISEFRVTLEISCERCRLTLSCHLNILPSKWAVISHGEPSDTLDLKTYEQPLFSVERSLAGLLSMAGCRQSSWVTLKLVCLPFVQHVVMRGQSFFFFIYFEKKNFLNLNVTFWFWLVLIKSSILPFILRLRYFKLTSSVCISEFRIHTDCAQNTISLTEHVVYSPICHSTSGG